MLFTSWLLWRRRAITIMMLIIVMIVYNRLHGGHGFNCFSCFATAKITFTSILICFVCASSQSLTVTLSKKTFSPLITQFVFRCFLCCLCCLGVLLLLLCLGVSCGYVAVVVFKCFVWFCSCCCV